MTIGVSGTDWCLPTVIRCRLSRTAARRIRITQVSCPINCHGFDHNIIERTILAICWHRTNCVNHVA